MKKTSLSTISLLTLTPISLGVVSTLATSCGCSQTKYVEVGSTTVKANENNIATIEVTFTDQPKDDIAMVSVTSNSDVKLEIVENKNSYNAINTINVADKKATVTVGVVEKQTKSVDVDFDLNFSYQDQNNKAISYSIQHMKLQVEVDPTQTTDEVHMLSINDFHGAVPGYGSSLYKVNYDVPGALRMARDTHDIIDKYPGSVLLSAGDNNSDYLYSAATHAATLFPMLKAMDIPYSAVGNHAWEWGSDYLTQEKYDQWGRTSSTTGKYLVTANVLNDSNLQTKKWALPGESNYDSDYMIWKNQKVSWADSYKVLNMKGHRICIIGLTTQKTIEDGNSDATKCLSFIDYEASVNYAKRQCLETIGQTDYDRIESFILLTHVESDYTDPQNPTGAAIDIAKSITTNIDAVISAHSHKIGTAKVYNGTLKKDVWVGQAGKSGVRFLDTKLVLDNTKPTGQKLTSLEMETRTPTIDYGGYDPESEQGKEAATNDWNNLINNPKDSFNENVVNEYKKQTEIVEKELDFSYATAEYDAAYPMDPARIGHYYTKFDNIIEGMGAWVCKAMIAGFTNIYCNGNADVEKPWIAMSNQDGILESWKKDEQIKKKNMFACQPHDNKTVMGWLTIGQIWNIINYSLCGEKNFNYSKNKVYPGKLNKNLIDKEETSCSTVDLEITGTSENTSCYLCGPLQMYGISFELEKNTLSSIDADYQVKHKELTLDDVTYDIPLIKFYDPTNSECKLDNPNSWISAETYIKDEIEKGSKKLIPVLIPDFMYNGKLAANRMFKDYFLYCQSIDSSKKATIYSQYTRDLLIEFSENWAKSTPLAGTFILRPEAVKALVTKPE